MPPSGPSIQITEMFNSLHLNVPQILFRIPPLYQLLYKPCYYCRRRLNDTDGYPLGRIGFLPPSPKAAPTPDVVEKDKAEGQKGEAGSASDGMADGEKIDTDKADEEKANEEKGVIEKRDGDKADGPTTDAEKKEDDQQDDKGAHEKMDVDNKHDKDSEGRWVCWHASCQVRSGV